VTGLAPAAIAAVFVVGLILERALIRYRVAAYVGLGVPLGVEIAPIPDVPEGDGATRLVRWARRGDVVLFWADPGRSVAPMGLHGSVRFEGSGPRKRVDVRWAPPLAPLGAAAWVALVGWSRGEPIIIPFVIVIVSLVFWAFRSFALKAAHELRWAWVGAPEQPLEEP
jgi:hypothetical protein